jgi:hypothetical protein
MSSDIVCSRSMHPVIAARSLPAESHLEHPE